MESIKKVSDIVAAMAAASEEQATGIEQVNTAVTQMDETTQQNAALVEEAAAAAKSMEPASDGRPREICHALGCGDLLDQKGVQDGWLPALQAVSAS